MTEKSTLMAYLVPRLTRQVEDAATDALGYILNKSAQSMQALNDLLRGDGFDIEPIARVKTQVTYEDGSRPDMTGYDQNNVKRLLVEAKFGAALLDGQASDYVQQLDQSGPAVLLFISPVVRISTLWAGIVRQMQGRLKRIESPQGVKRAKVIGTDRHIVLISWARLLDAMAAMSGDAAISADIRQLQGLAQGQDAKVFLPIHTEELSPSIGRRLDWYCRLADNVVDDRGVEQQWMNIENARATPQRYGYGRYFRFSGVAGFFWFGVNHQEWARSGDTPLWLLVDESNAGSRDAIGRALSVEVQDGWVPIHLRLGVEYCEVLDNVETQLKRIAEVVGVRPELLRDHAL